MGHEMKSGVILKTCVIQNSFQNLMNYNYWYLYSVMSSFRCRNRHSVRHPLVSGQGLTDRNLLIFN
jgi:hypothetical protein